MSGRTIDVHGPLPKSDSDTSSAIVVDGLLVRGPNGQELFGPTSFRTDAGTITALTGASGSGKTTLMRALLGHLPEGATRQAGSASVAGHDVFTLDPAARQRFRRTQVAFVGQDPGSALNPLMRVHALLREVAEHASRDALVTTLELVGLSAEQLRRRPAELSGGQQRRVALARALIRHTGVLILDEPLAGLHGALRTDIARLLTEIAAERRAAILLSGHDTATVHAIADNVIELGAHPAVVSSNAAERDSAQNAPKHRGVTTPRRHAAALDGREGDPSSEDAATHEPSMPSAAAASVMLCAKNISAAINDCEVLHGIGLELSPGEALAVVGASGAGKTTLARVIAGLCRAATGTLELRGASIPITRGSRTAMGSKGIQLVTQNPRSALNPRRTVAQTLGRPLRRIGGVPRTQLAQRITDLLRSVELAEDLAARYPHELSGGQRQRVALARALAAEPAVLICDEITSALDTATATSIMTLLDRLRADRAMGLLVITHDMTMVAAHCPRLLVLDHGRIVESGATDTVLAAPAHAATHALLR
ncbi:ABC transporter ATP-binding protein [Nocardia altamirensis]|uniref:ABC transporter ATP-binding protein n=1 Tax=Nocardia altamirensis TaxID=472158 RepID=UPI00083FED53|nr:ATP-binding cassette domain-containing protein [Nocardia altamirensis]